MLKHFLFKDICSVRFTVSKFDVPISPTFLYIGVSLPKIYKMHQVTGKYPNYSNPSRESSFYLDADKGFVYFVWSPPIHWTGRVGGLEVRFTQTSSSGSSKSDYDWSSFPEEAEDAIPYIVEAIDRAMRVMD